ncbi:MAG TPA: hypothetical protein EYP85_12145 [Armatimonadetes bacterium]|nr:hypothetical protein [Armatimonadota bacterium]
MRWWTRYYCLAAGLIGTLAQAAQVQVAGERAVVGNEVLCRFVSLTDGHVRTLGLQNLHTGAQWKWESEEFLLQLLDGPALTTADFEVAEVQAQSGETAALTVTLRHAGRPRLQVVVHYTARDGEHWLRKWLEVEGEAIVDRVEVERFRTDAQADLGGFGQPLYFAGHWFLGLEYPGAYQVVEEGVVSLRHFPGRARFTSKVAVCGGRARVGPGLAPIDRQVAEAFDRYLRAVRRPPRSFLQYNSWYDLRGPEMTVTNFIARFHQFREKLLEPYGLTLQAFVPDAGWQLRQSIWACNPRLLPQGFRPLAEELEKHGSRLGLWMPLNGYGLDTHWGWEQGYEVSNRGPYYCLVGPRYNAALRDMIRRRLEEGNLAYFKHDFNHLRCEAEGHGHLPTERHGFEANLDAELDLLAYERRLQSDIFLNLTSGMWLSPWWLLHADTIWMAASDFGYDKTYPQLSPREWAMSYRDEHLYRKYRLQQRQFPLSALMTHGLIHGQRNRLGGPHETLAEWSDYVVMYYARGVMLKEWYLTPDLLPDDWAEVLGRATQWASANTETLLHTRLIGGEPRRGEVYGYAHWSARKGILALRNPGLEEQPFTVTLNERPAFPQEPAAWQVEMVYPYRYRWEKPVTRKQGTTVMVPPCSVCVYHLTPRLEETPRQPVGVRFAVREEESGSPQVVVYHPPEQPPAVVGQCGLSGEGPRQHLALRLHLAPEERARCDLLIICLGQKVELSSPTLNGQPLKLRRETSDGWTIFQANLMGVKGGVQLEAEVLGERGLFTAGRGTLKAWLVVDRRLKGEVMKETPEVAPEPLPCPLRADWQRVTVRLLEPTALAPLLSHRGISDEELRHIKAAKLHLEIFDVNGGRYADKWILLNGQRLAQVPFSRPPVSRWEERIVDVPVELLPLIRRRNLIAVTNEPGDSFKIRGLALAVQTAAGRWVETSLSERILCTPQDWLYAEGEVWPGNLSPAVELVLPEPK